MKKLTLIDLNADVLMKCEPVEINQYREEQKKVKKRRIIMVNRHGGFCSGSRRRAINQKWGMQKNRPRNQHGITTFFSIIIQILIIPHQGKQQ